MGVMNGWTRILARVGTVAGALTSVGLIAVAVLVDLDTAGQVASVAGAIGGLAALGVSLYALRSDTSAPARGVAAGGERAIAVGGSVHGVLVTGDRVTVNPVGTAPAAPPSAAGPVTAGGARSIAVGGDLAGLAATGDDTGLAP